MGRSIDDDIDALYQGPASEFTAGRNVLARRAGDRAAEVRALARPQAAAWAINQIYWHRRAVFDALVKASEVRRAAHVQQLHGEGAGVAAADARHHAALDAACIAAAAALRDAGDALSPATLDAIRRTLEAIPSSDIRGRLTRPVEPVGFSMLASLMAGGPSLPTHPPGDVVMMKRPGSARGEVGAQPSAPTKREQEQVKKAAAAARRAADARQRESDELTRQLAAATVAEQQATDALHQARAAAEVASQDLDRREREAAQARTVLAERRAEAEDARRAVNTTTTARIRIERHLRELDV